MNGSPPRADFDCVVIGSGPAGVFCSLALLEQGRKVTLIDVGTGPDTEIQRLLKQIQNEGTRAEALRALELRGKTEKIDDQGIPMKLAYGSDYPYEAVDQFFSTQANDCDVKGSFAQGGFSSVWGAAMLPYRDEDIEHWPFPLNRLVPHYEAVLRQIPFAAGDDHLAQLFPLYERPQGPIDVGPQVQRFLDNTASHQETLTRNGIFVGRSRVAVRVSDERTSGCWYCGQCMTGCPDQHIFSSKDLLPFLKRHPGFEYLRGSALIQIDERPERVELVLRDTKTGHLTKTSCIRLFLGAGPLISSSLVIGALKMWDRPFICKDSQYFITPFVSFRGSPQVRTLPSFSLSQAFLEVVKPTNRQSVHFQLYGYSNLIARAIRSHLKGVKSMVRPFLGAIWGRLIIAQGFMHSEDSPSIEMRVTPGAGGQQVVKIALRRVECDRALSTVDGTLKLLNSYKWKLGGTFSRRATEITQPGRSFHFGGTFPMMTGTAVDRASDETGFSWSDLLGRPQGLFRVHLIDASCFSSIPAAPITLSIMANAHRIGMESASLDFTA